MVTSPRILVTGAGGFIGGHIVRRAQACGLPVTALLRTRSDRLCGVDIVESDLTTADLNALIGRIAPTIIINAASYGVHADEPDQDRMIQVNLTAVRSLVSAAKAAKVPRFVQLGTYNEYGDWQSPVSEDTPVTPKEPYARSKAKASALVADRNAMAPVEGIVLRLFNVWGPYEHPHRLLQQVIRHCRANTRFPLTSGRQVKEWCYAEDVANWILDIALRPDPWPHSVVNMGSGFRISVRDMALAAARALKGEHLLAFGEIPVPDKEVQTGPADLTRVSELLPNRRFTALDDGIAATIAATP